MIKNDNKMFMNTTMLLIMNVAKLIFPLLTLPYLTRILSIDSYGVVAYVKSIMTYMQVFVDFGFVLSGTKEIVQNRGDLEKVGKIIGNAMLGKLILASIGTIFLIILASLIPILDGYLLYLFLSQVAVFISCFFFEYLFRGIEQMHVITIRFVIMKVISTGLTFVFVKSDADMLWIPFLDIVSYFVAAVLTIKQIQKMGLKIKITSFKPVLLSLKSSFFYFLSNMASTAFNVLNTLLIGIFSSASDVAFWSVCLQLINAVQNVYPSISDGIYPQMVKTKDFSIVTRILKIFMPIITLGCVFTILVSKYVLMIVGGAEYEVAAPILRGLVPVLFFSFLTYMLGWPSLGVIGKVNETTKTTVYSALFQICGLLLLAVTDRFSLINIAILRSITEGLLAFLRGRYCYKYRDEFEKKVKL